MSTPFLSRRPLTPEDVDRIAAIADPVIRNLRITQAYHELSAATAARLGAHRQLVHLRDVGFEAGRTDDPQGGSQARPRGRRSDRRRTRYRAADDVETEAGRFGASIPLDASLATVWAIVDPAAALDRASAAVARGNLRVFEEIGREFARFDVEWGPDAAADPDALARFIEQLRPGEPPTGQRYLRQAFSHFDQRARSRLDPIRAHS